MAASDTTATFSVDLVDGTSGAADSAAKALKRLEGQLDSDVKALSAMQKAMKNLQAGSSVNIAQFKDLKSKIDAKKQSISQAQSAILSLGGSFDRVSKSKLPGLIDKLRESASQAPGPLGSMVNRLGGVGKLLSGGAIALGLVAVAAGLAALTAAAVAATAVLLQYGIAQADARRNELLHLESLTKLRFWYSAVAGDANQMQASIDRVSDSVDLGRDKVAQYTNQLYKMGLRGQNLDDALEGVAIKAATQGDAAASAFAGWTAGAAMAGQSVRRLTDDVKARLGGIAEAQLLSLGAQSRRLQKSFSALFSGLKIEGFLKSLKMVTDLFSQSTASGRALKTIINTVFQPMINSIEILGPIVKRFFQGIIIGALTIGIYLLQVRNHFKKAFGDSEILKGFDSQTLAVKAGIAAISLMAGTVLVLTAGLTAMVVPLGLVAAGWYGIYKAMDKVLAFFDMNWSELGRSIVDGIVKGIVSGRGVLAGTMQGLGDMAWKSFKNKLGISSPSKVFAKLGLAIPQGVQTGVNVGAPGVKREVESMVDIPNIPASSVSESGGGSKSAGQGINIDVGGIYITSSGSGHQQMDNAFEDFKVRVTQVFEGIAVQLGANVPGGV